MNTILISGATGVGTSSLASTLAKERNILYVVGTDALREAAKQLIIPDVNPFLHKSTYEASKSPNYESKSDDVKKEKIVRGFKTQCSAVKVCIDGVITRYVREGSLVIIEGIHLIPGNYQRLIGQKTATQILIDIENEDLHRERLEYREHKNPSRGSNYLRNFREIRWLRDYLSRKAKESQINIVDNSGRLEETVRQCLALIRL